MKKTLCALCIVMATASAAIAGQIGHYAGGHLNIRDFAVPAPGFYGILYNYYYRTGRLNDANGDERGSVNINPGPGPGVHLDIDPEVDVYALVPVVAWVTPYKFLGADFAMLLAPTFSNNSIGASLETASGRGVNPDTGQFGIGDWLFQPIWLGWHLEHFDFSFGYGFYAPTGKYDTDQITIPGGDVTVASADNIGLGFWTNQFQGAGIWYPWANKATAVLFAATYEIHSEKKNYELKPGQNLSINWGISQYLPLTRDQKWLAEIGPAGYDQFQVTEDHGKDAGNELLDQVHAAGGQAGITSVDWEAALNFHYFYEYASEDRFQGQVFGLTALKKF